MIEKSTMWWSALGAIACRAGVKLGMCKIPELTPEWNAWRQGWMREYNREV